MLNLESLNPRLKSSEFMFDYHLFQRLSPKKIDKALVEKIEKFVSDELTPKLFDTFNSNFYPISAEN